MSVVVLTKVTGLSIMAKESEVQNIGADVVL